VNDPIICEFGGIEPEISAEAWLAPGVVVTGDVHVAAGANLWFGVVARGDVDRIEIGPCVNVQDGTVLHTDYDYPLILERDVAIGHRAIVHGCTVEVGSLIGMGATVLSGARIGAGSIVGAGAVVLEGVQIPERSLVVGIPARIVGETSGQDATAICLRYRERAAAYRKALAAR
jgi:carbonic anhydrase/acetyltransferase-like protein (isoleucine patch superfamily)